MMRWYTREPAAQKVRVWKSKPAWLTFRVYMLDRNESAYVSTTDFYNSELSKYNARYCINKGPGPSLDSESIEFENERDFTYFLLRFG